MSAPQTQLDALLGMRDRLPAAQRRVLAYVEEHPGAVRNEVDRDLGAGQPNANFSRRLTELERAGLIHRGAPRICTVSGHRAATWRPGPGLAALEAFERPKSRRVVLEDALARIKAQLECAAVFPDGAIERIRHIVDNVTSDSRRSA